MPQIASTFSTLSPVSIVKDSPVTRSAIVTPQSATANAAQPAHSVANILASAVNRGIEPIRGDHADHAAGRPARYLGVARRAAPGIIGCRRQSRSAERDHGEPDARTERLQLGSQYQIFHRRRHRILRKIHESSRLSPSTIQGDAGIQGSSTKTKVTRSEPSTPSWLVPIRLFSVTAHYQEILVTDSTATEGTPPAGSVIAAINIWPLRDLLLRHSLGIWRRHQRGLVQICDALRGIPRSREV